MLLGTRPSIHRSLYLLVNSPKWPFSPPSAPAIPARRTFSPPFANLASRSPVFVRIAHFRCRIRLGLRPAGVFIDAISPPASPGRGLSAPGAASAHAAAKRMRIAQTLRGRAAINATFLTHSNLFSFSIFCGGDSPSRRHFGLCEIGTGNQESGVLFGCAWRFASRISERLPFRESPTTGSCRRRRLPVRSTGNSFASASGSRPRTRRRADAAKAPFSSA